MREALEEQGRTSPIINKSEVVPQKGDLGYQYSANFSHFFLLCFYFYVVEEH